MNRNVLSWILLKENILLALTYWGISHLNYTIFRNVGVLPMPIWPAAALAFVAAFYRGWRVAPGIAFGTIMANHYSLHATWIYACCIAIMNTLGPITGAALMRNRISIDFYIHRFSDLLVCFLAALILTPVMTATGGIGFKWLLNLQPTDELAVAWLKWFTAHSLGTLLFAPPAFAWLQNKEKSE